MQEIPYTITVALEVEATSPEVAAEIAKDWLIDSEPTRFVVIDDDSGVETLIVIDE